MVRLLWRREALMLVPLFGLGFVLRLFPLLQFPRVGFDPFFHYELSMALLEGKTSVDVVTRLGEHLTGYYPPLFHLLSLFFFLAFPVADPYLIMKVIVSVLDSLQLFPVYFIVKDVSKSTTGAAIAAFVAMITPSDFNMISWGGYANIAGLLLIAILAYLVIKEKPVAVGFVSAILFLTHHLSMLFSIALFVPYFLIVWWKTRRLPKCLVTFVAAMAVAYVAFYWYALNPLLDMYTTYSARYAEFILPTNWPQLFGLPLLVAAAFGIGLWVYKTRAVFAKPDLLLYMWLLLPLLLGYAYVFGVEWDTVRWIYFLQQPACVWCGITAAQFKNRKLIVAMIVIAFVLQWIGTMQTYNSEIWANAGYTY
jgi:hypothetical protein